MWESLAQEFLVKGTYGDLLIFISYSILAGGILGALGFRAVDNIIKRKGVEK